MARMKETKAQRDLRELSEAIEGLVRAHRGFSRRFNELTHQVAHLVERVTALDGQHPGGDERTNLARAEAGPASGDYYRQQESAVDTPDEP